MSVIELSFHEKETEPCKHSMRKGMGREFLLRSVRWFIKVRWIVVVILYLAGAVEVLFPEILDDLELKPTGLWPWFLASVLVLANTMFAFLVSRLKETTSFNRIETNIWIQIIVDLIVVTVLVHIIGSIETFISFIYLFHITLACIVFARQSSFLVTLFASVLYLACVGLEYAGVCSSSTILAQEHYQYRSLSLCVIFSASAIFIWFFVWYLVSTLSIILQERNRQILEANRQLMDAEQRMNRQVLKTTHELKAPFSGMESNIQLIRMHHWEELSGPVKDLIIRIETRAITLASRIKEILILGGLKSEKANKKEIVPLGIKAIIKAAINEIKDRAKERNITINAEIDSVDVLGEEDGLKILFSNLIANGVFYSYENGEVDVVSREEGDEICVCVSDRGIGIKEEALPDIFDEYYRTKEGARFNKYSTGLGLSIVKEIAENLNLRIKVESVLGKGTAVEVFMPRVKKQE